MLIPNCPECGQPLTSVTKVCTYVVRVNFSESGGKVNAETYAPEFVSVDDYECGNCFAVLPDVLMFDTLIN